MATIGEIATSNPTPSYYNSFNADRWWSEHGTHYRTRHYVPSSVSRGGQETFVCPHTRHASSHESRTTAVVETATGEMQPSETGQIGWLKLNLSLASGNSTRGVKRSPSLYMTTTTLSQKTDSPAKNKNKKLFYFPNSQTATEDATAVPRRFLQGEQQHTCFLFFCFLLS